MFELVDEAIVHAGKAVAEFEPEVHDGRAAALLVERFAHLERLASAGKALAARRVADSGAWRRGGERSPAHWMANRTGTSVGQALGVLETAARLDELPETERALRAGQLSPEQAKEIASAAAASPAHEEGLLSTASRESMRGLKEACARVKAAALPDELAQHERLRRRRRLRHWSDAEGAFRLEALLPPEAGATVLAALEPLREEIFARARKQGLREPYEAYAADALVALAQAACSGTEGKGSSPRATVHVRVDHAALLRGASEPGEVCEIPGVGPIPVASARALAQDAWVCALVTDGGDVRAVTSMKRTIPTRVRRALYERDRSCAVPGCDVRHHLQIDHTIPVHEGGPTRLDNLDLLCAWHHYLKTHRGYRLLGPRDGVRTWTGPPGEP